MKALALTALLLAVASIHAAAPLNLDKCGDLSSYRVAPYLEVASALQALPKEVAIAQLKEWSDPQRHNEQVIILCRMLFEMKDDSEFRRPRLGSPHFYGDTSMKDWPLEPITLVDNIPFKIVTGYNLAGMQENSFDYLKYCLENAQWTSRHYKPATKEEISSAFQKLVNFSIWKKSLAREELAWFRQQTLN